MQNSLLYIVNGLVLSGGCLLAAALFPVWRLIGQLPVGTVRDRWKILLGLILFFIAGYLGYAIVNWKKCCTLSDLVVPVVFFSGAIFVVMVCFLALKTAVDLKRVYALEQETITDPLMGIYNRRFLERRLAEELVRAQRYKQPLSILLLDIDFFKNINDTHGHHAGDLVLQQLGELIANFVRDSDVVARYGGEEIVVVLPNTVSPNAALLAERLRLKVEETKLAVTEDGENGLQVRMTVSIGIAGLGKTVLDAQTFLAMADRALYQAKRGGRNRTVVAE